MKENRRPMGRPREFDEDVVVNRAMNAFWMHGYRGSSLPDLLDATQLTRGSFYKAFGSKRDMFVMAFDLYMSTEAREVIEILSDYHRRQPDGLARLEMVFDEALARYHKGDRRGCFIYNSLTEIGDSDDVISERVTAAMDSVGAAFRRAVSEVENKARPLSEEEIDLWTSNIFMSFLGFKMHIRSGLDYDLNASLKLLRERVGKSIYAKEAMGTA